jgi:cytochrome c556
MSSASVFRRAAGVALVFSLATIGVVSAAPSVRDQIKARQDKLRDMGGALKGIDDELKKRSPDWANTIAGDADTLVNRAPYLLNWFPKGTGPETGIKTYALPAIWQKPDDFTKLGKAMQAEVVKLKQVAATKNADATKAQVLATGKTCKACHDGYRSKDYEKDEEENAE